MCAPLGIDLEVEVLSLAGYGSGVTGALMAAFSSQECANYAIDIALNHS